VLAYNDVDGLEAAFDELGDQIAAVIVEPVAGNMGTVKSSLSFRHALRHLTSECGALLIFDEVMSGFRVALGGAQELFDVTPDLSTFGKVIGGGLPVGAYGGRADLMDHIMPVGPVFQAGTLSGNPLATAAGIATLTALREPGVYDRLERLSSRLAGGLDDAATAAGIPHSIGYVGAMQTLFFNDEEVTDWDSASRCDTERFGQFFWGMADRGVYLPCSQYEAMFVSLAHTEAMIDHTIQAAAEVFVELGK